MDNRIEPATYFQVFETNTTEKDSSGSAPTATGNLQPNSPPSYVESNLASMYVSAVENPASLTKREVSFSFS